VAVCSAIVVSGGLLLGDRVLHSSCSSLATTIIGPREQASKKSISSI
jgi:hypothetical protein